MDWIKKHYDQFALAVISTAVLGLAIFLYLRAQNFNERFAEALQQPIENNKVPPVVLDQIDKANALLSKPPAWTVPASDAPSDRGSLFVSERYMLNKDGNPTRPDVGSIYSDSLTGKPIPNTWFLDNNLPLFDPGVCLQDPDNDGFPNEVEWRLKTDPNSKESHPPYYAMLFLKQVIRVPFRLRFLAYDGDLKKDPKFEKFSFQIKTMDLRQPSEFLSIGDTVANTKFKLEKFEYKTKMNPSTLDEEDVSELTVVNTETGDKAVLVLNKVVNSPDYYIRFDYQWPASEQPPSKAGMQPPKPGEIVVKRLGFFVLQPNIGVNDRYKLIDIKDDDVVIQLPDGQTAADGTNKVTIKRDPRKK
jgi:hypothetical protein